MPIETGKSKQLQMENIARFVKLEQKVYKYVVVEIYDKPLVKKDGRDIGNHSIYVTWIESVLLNYFIKEKKVTCSFTKSNLQQLFGFTNDNYYIYYKDRDCLNKLTFIDSRMSKWMVKNFYQRVNAKLNKVVKDALNSLQRRKLIEYKETIWARKTLPDNRYKYFEVKQANQIAKILECEREALEELGCRSLNEVIFSSNKSKNWDKYKQIRDELLFNELEFDFVYRKYSVICNQKYLAKGLQENEEELIRSLNTEFKDAVDKQARDIFKKNREDLIANKTSFKYPDNYPLIQKMISDKLLKLEAESLMKELYEAEKAIEENEEIEALFGAA